MTFLLSFSKLGNHGRLGNQLFQIMGTLGLAERLGFKPSFPEWQYERYFAHALPHEGTNPFKVHEAAFHFHEWVIPETGADIKGYLQSEKYFPTYARSVFEFKPDFIESVKAKTPGLWNGKPNLVLQIRRGDYVGNPNYYQLSIMYYIDCLLTHFPEYKDYNVVLFSDDLPYCRVHFECLENAFFTDALNDIEQIALASLCDHFIIPNSSFGWWCAWLGEKPHSKIVHCGHLQAGKLLEQNDPRDYYPERWTRHQKDDYRIALRDVTFTIPVTYDHNDRKKNLDLTLCILQQSFDANYSVAEQYAPGSFARFEIVSQWANYFDYTGKDFHRTKMLNDMALKADTLIVANWDADVIIPPMQVYLTVEKLRASADAVYPYDGRFARMDRAAWFGKLEKYLDIGIVGDAKLSGKNGGPMPQTSVGGCVFWLRDSFIEYGMENENFVSFGPEDVERWERLHALGARVERVGGALYHVNHWCGPNSGKSNPHFKANDRELEKIRKMDRTGLLAYVDSWPWRNPYTARYYERISEGSRRSATEVYRILADRGIAFDCVIDVGSGIGAWKPEGCDIYTGIDKGIPPKVQPEGYIDADLEGVFPAPPRGKYDLALCLEVAEHLSPERAAPLVAYLCNLSYVVLFSAAVPLQGGTGHINEQSASYWAALFAEHGFYPASWDIRREVWHNENVEPWYKNNLVLYVKGGKPRTNYELDVIHPEMFKSCVTYWKNARGG